MPKFDNLSSYEVITFYSYPFAGDAISGPSFGYLDISKYTALSISLDSVNNLNATGGEIVFQFTNSDSTVLNSFEDVETSNGFDEKNNPTSSILYNVDNLPGTDGRRLPVISLVNLKRYLSLRRIINGVPDNQLILRLILSAAIKNAPTNIEVGQQVVFPTT